MKPKSDLLERRKTKFSKEFHYVLDKAAHPCPESCRVQDRGSYVVHPVNPLVSAEGAFNLVPASYGLSHVPVIFRREVLFGWSSERFAVRSYFHVLQ